MIEKLHPSDLLRTDRQGRDGLVFDPMVDKINEIVEEINRLTEFVDAHDDQLSDLP